MLHVRSSVVIMWDSRFSLPSCPPRWWILYHLGDLLQNIYVMDILEQGRQFLSWYILFAGAYALIALIVYTVRYNRMRRRMRAYLNGMRRLSRMMQEGKSG